MTSRCLQCGVLLEESGPGPSSIEVGGTTRASSRCPSCDAAVEVSVDEVSVDPERTRTFLPGAGEEEGHVAHFTLLRLLGRGGFGEVWLAEDQRLGRNVALKLPRPSKDSQGLLFEARTAASLRHPNIVPVFEVGEDSGQVFIASEYIDGCTLRDFLTQGRTPFPRVVDLLIPIARALHFAHERGIIHRDIKPANILLDRSDQPFLADFGIARQTRTKVSEALEGQVVGTARYMSPEQADGKISATDARSDIYALGVTMFEMLTGETPFRGNVSAVLRQKVSDDPPSPRRFDSAIPKDLETICLKCLERTPDKRFATAQELVDELTRVQVGEPIRSRPISGVERLWRWCRRRPAVSSLLASTFLSLTLGLLGVSIFWRQAAASAAAVRESLYRSRMNLISNHLQNGDIVGVREMLDRVAADVGGGNAERDFALDYFKTIVRPLHPVANAGDFVRGIAISRDGGLCAAIGGGFEVRVWDAGANELIRILRTEVEPFGALDFSPTSAQLATGGHDGFVRIWEPLSSGRMLREMKHGPRVVLVRHSPDGGRLVSLGAKGAARLWDVATGAKLAEIPTGQSGAPRDARFSADGKTLYVATDRGHVRVWDLEPIVRQGAAQVPLPVRQFDVSPELECLAVSSDGTQLVAGDFHGILTVHSLETGESTRQQTYWGRVDAVEFVAGTRLVAAAANDGQLHLFDTERRQEIRSLNTHGLISGTLAMSADGRTLVVGSGDGSVSTLRLEGLTIPSILWHGVRANPGEVGKNAPPPVRGLQLLPDGRRAIAAYDTGEMRVWDLRTGRWTPLSTDGEHTGRIVTLQPGGGKLFATAWNKPTVTLWNAETLQVERTVTTSETGAVAIAFSTSGRRFAVAGRGDVTMGGPQSSRGSGPIAVYDTGDWSRPIRELPAAPESTVLSLAFSPDDRTLAVARSRSGLRDVESDGEADQTDGPGDGADLVDIATGTIGRHVPVELPSTLAYCRDGMLAVATMTGQIVLWDTREARIRGTIKGHTGRIHALVVLPESDTLVTAGRDRDIKLWDIPSGELITPLQGHIRQVFSLAAAADGTKLLSGGLEGEIRVWSAEPTGPK